MKRVWGVIAATTLVAAPAIALACPACAGREDPGIGVATMIGLLIAVPYAVAMFAIRAIRRVENGEAQ